MSPGIVHATLPVTSSKFRFAWFNAASLVFGKRLSGFNQLLQEVLQRNAGFIVFR